MSHSETLLKCRVWFSSSGVRHDSSLLSSPSNEPGADATGSQLTLSNDREITCPDKKANARWGSLGAADYISELSSPSFHASDGSGSGQGSSGPAQSQHRPWQNSNPCVNFAHGQWIMERLYKMGSEYLPILIHRNSQYMTYIVN